MKYMIITLALLFSFEASATELIATLSNSSITKFRTHSSSHPVIGARKTHMFYAAGLANNCKKLFFVLDENKEMYSLLLAAYISKLDITVRYEAEVTSPWGDSSACRLNSVTLGE